MTMDDEMGKMRKELVLAFKWRVWMKPRNTSACLQAKSWTRDLQNDWKGW